ncbi:2-dehydro-3-deoxy-6-phosphogalactonate aldolase [Paracoccus sp. Z330]|uniref:2-dehydro-3-deoxy-6-phosphogalactonate aldolase n=1 Tax=Paracoccus onchidii TaxID=3017813 RepID=A0ABT4ZGI8_9RHOB|nr:2-dehydro-3-deoxy-6-phosphogalactonate aldolase [Paracoccus onchidii]MDB6178384.1 2-dehydro-3-deoxy-6-phosphogalactonate aldolase [Paracoccus onchidii]
MTNRTPLPELRRPLVAILRGLRPEEAQGHIGVLVDAGFEAVEVPLNSPEPFDSIATAVDAFGAQALIGAGTVLDPRDVDRLADLGAKLIVTPNPNAAVIASACGHGMVSIPGVFTPGEALSAWQAGASALKFFPAGVLGPEGIAAIRAILPAEAPVAAVGGASEDNFAQYIAKGISIFGLGSSLYKPGMGRDELKQRALGIIAAYDNAMQAVRAA